MCITSCANGSQIKPFLIHSNGGKAALNDDYIISPKIVSNLAEVPGVGVARTKNGSMERFLFVKYAHHFVKHLPAGYGKNGKAVCLTLDGHTSRWCPVALRYLKDNNVFVWCLASHTSMWTQPNDMGVNARVKALTHECFRLWLRSNPRAIMGQDDYNGMFATAWNKFLALELYELTTRPDKTNVASRAFAKAGLFPFLEQPPFWYEACLILGTSPTAASTASPPAPQPASKSSTTGLTNFVETAYLAHIAAPAAQAEEREENKRKRKGLGGIPSTRTGADCGAEGIIAMIEANAKKKKDEGEAAAVERVRMLEQIAVLVERMGELDSTDASKVKSKIRRELASTGITRTRIKAIGAAVDKETGEKFGDFEKTEVKAAVKKYLEVYPSAAKKV